MQKYTATAQLKKALALVVATPFVLALLALAIYLAIWIMPVAVPAIIIGGFAKSYRRYKLTGSF
jgi:hypothetical protein